MADIALNTTAAQDAILERLRVKTNEERATQDPPLAALADIPALVKSILIDAVQSYRKQQIEEDIAEIGEVYANGTNAKRADIRTAAGL